MKTLSFLILLIFLPSLAAEEIKYKPHYPIYTQEQLNEMMNRYKSMDESGINQSTNPLKFSENERAITTKNASESEVHAAINPTNPLNIVLSPIMSGQDGFETPIYYSMDGGQTWSLSNFKPSPPFDFLAIVGGGDPVFVFDKNGIVYYSWINVSVTQQGYIAGTYSAKSTDGGENWEFINALDEINFSTGEGVMLDKQWMACDLSADESNPYLGNIYVSAVRQDNEGQNLGLYRYSQATQKFDFVKRINSVSKSYFQFATLDVDDDSKIHVTFFGANGGGLTEQAFYHAVFTDGGETLLNETKITDIFVDKLQSSGSSNGIDGLGRDYPSPYMALGLSDSEENQPVYLTWSSSGIYGPSEDRSNVYFVRSLDGGLTWETPRDINPESEEQGIQEFYPAISVNDKGVIGISYYDRRLATDGTLETHYLLKLSFDNGESFGSPIFLSSTPSDFNQYSDKGNQVDFGIGEYNALILTDTEAVAFWGDGRKGNKDTDIYGAWVDLNPSSIFPSKVNGLFTNFKINSISPNPSSDIIHFDLNNSKQDFTVEIISTNGKKLFSTKMSGISNTLDISSLSSGAYLLRVSYDGSYAIKQFIKE
jgi:Secretion system C-terminal sorting domain